jgi:hypothetical protein
MLGTIDKNFKVIEDRFENQMVVKTLGFGKGQMVNE